MFNILIKNLVKVLKKNQIYKNIPSNKVQTLIIMINKMKIIHY